MGLEFEDTLTAENTYITDSAKALVLGLQVSLPARQQLTRVTSPCWRN